VIAAHIPIRAQAGPTAIVTAADREVPGVWETASAAGPCDVIIWAGTRDTGPLARLVTSRDRAPGGGTRAGGCPVVYRQET
jgi:hypothetical protein